MKITRRALQVLAIAWVALAPAMLTTVPAGASGGTTVKYWVSASATPGGPNTSCANAGYSTIQSAVNAAEGLNAPPNVPPPVVKVCTGTYSEQVTITKSMSLVAANGPVTIELPAAVGASTSLGLSTTYCQIGDAAASIQDPQSVIEICAAGPSGSNTSGTNVSISGVTVQGDWSSNVCYDSLYGILVGGGASLDLANSIVTGVGGSGLTDGCQGGVGIQVGFSPTNQAGTATLTGDTVTDYQKNGITIDGTGSSATITGGTVTGVGLTPAIGQNGIQVSYGATASITGVTVSANECRDIADGCGPDPWSQVQSTGILFYDNGTPSSLTSSNVTDNDVGVASIQSSTPGSGPGVTIADDTITGGYESVYQDSGWASVKSDKLTGAVIGIWVPEYSSQPSAATVTAKKDIITGMTSTDGLLAAAVEVESDGQGGDLTPAVSITNSDLSNNPYGVLNNGSAIVSATGDYWGSASGPSGKGIGPGGNAAADVDVNFFPWATSVVDSGTVAHPGGAATCTVQNASSVSSHAAGAILCLTGSGTVNYHGSGPALIYGTGTDAIILGTTTNPASGISMFLNGGSSTVLANNSSGGFQLQNGATANVTNGTHLIQLTASDSPLVTS